MGAHPLVIRLWYFIALFQVCYTHSGFDGFTDWMSGKPQNAIASAEHHDLHHEFFNCNYGVLGICDFLFRTRAEDFGFDKAHNKRMDKYRSEKSK